MIDRDKVQVLAKALKESARNHHYQAMHLMDFANNAHFGQHWHHCPASSCTNVFLALYETRIFGAKELATRERVQEEMHKGLLKVLNGSV